MRGVKSRDMFTHVVLFTLKPEHKQHIAAARDLLLGMQGKIPGLLSIEVGIDELHTERSCDFGLITRFNSAADLAVYQDHPVHQEVLAFIRPKTERAHAIDFTA